jgi:hypothetical protein
MNYKTVRNEVIRGCHDYDIAPLQARLDRDETGCVYNLDLICKQRVDVQLRKDEFCRKSVLFEISTLLSNPQRHIISSGSSVCDADRFGIGAFRQDERGNDCQSYSTEAKHRVSTMK